MKDQAHHIKHIQKRVVRSARRKIKESKESEKEKAEQSKKKSINREDAVYDEVVPSDQQVLRNPTRQNYH